MKTVEVRYFAFYREQAGRESERLETAFETAGELFDSLCSRHDLAAAGGAKLAINDEIVDRASKLSDGDTILVFPPVSGG
jgi:molybdopterin converting factor subunit 1